MGFLKKKKDDAAAQPQVPMMDAAATTAFPAVGGMGMPPVPGMDNAFAQFGMPDSNFGMPPAQAGFPGQAPLPDSVGMPMPNMVGGQTPDMFGAPMPDMIPPAGVDSFGAPMPDMFAAQQPMPQMGGMDAMMAPDALFNSPQGISAQPQIYGAEMAPQVPTMDVAPAQTSMMGMPGMSSGVPAETADPYSSLVNMLSPAESDDVSGFLKSPDGPATKADVVGAILGIMNMIRTFDVAMAHGVVMPYSEYVHRRTELSTLSGTVDAEAMARAHEEEKLLSKALVYNDDDGSILQDVLFTVSGASAVPLSQESIYVRPYITTTAGYPILKFDTTDLLGNNETFNMGIVSFATLEQL